MADDLVATTKINASRQLAASSIWILCHGNAVINEVDT